MPAAGSEQDPSGSAVPPSAGSGQAGTEEAGAVALGFETEAAVLPAAGAEMAFRRTGWQLSSLSPEDDSRSPASRHIRAQTIPLPRCKAY